MKRKATLIVNPAAGRARLLNAQMPAIAALLSEHGYASEVLHTTDANDSARELAAGAARNSALVLACGGDGTIHGVIQGLAHTGVTLGVVPLGTANALARNLGLPLDPLQAVARLLTYKAFTIPLGELKTASHTRMFVVMAGCGPDGALVQALSPTGTSRLKGRFGRYAYYGHAIRLFFTREWPKFWVELRRPESELWERREAVAMMASRLPNLGGLFSGLTRRASLRSPHLHVQLLRPPAQLALPAWMLATRVGLPHPWLLTIDVEELRCLPLDGRAVLAQADAEPVGALPCALRLVPSALSLLMPPAQD